MSTATRNRIRVLADGTKGTRVVTLVGGPQDGMKYRLRLTTLVLRVPYAGKTRVVDIRYVMDPHNKRRFVYRPNRGRQADGLPNGRELPKGPGWWRK